MNIERLRMLEVHLRTFQDTPRKHFDMKIFYEESDCGTSACALGEAASMPEFRAQGLGIILISSMPVKNPLAPGSVCGWVVYRDDDGEEFEDFIAAQQFFDIAEEHAYWLFDPGEYFPHVDDITPIHVADRINLLISSGDSKATEKEKFNIGVFQE